MNVTYLGEGLYELIGVAELRAGVPHPLTVAQAQEFGLLNNNKFRVEFEASEVEPVSAGKIGFLGNVNVNSGYGGGSIDILRALSRAGLTAAVDPRLGVFRGELHAEALDQLGPRSWVPDVQIMHTVPDFFRLSSARTRIGFTMWETSSPPDGVVQNKYFGNWANLINTQSEALIVPSQHSREVFLRAGVRVPIAVANYGLDVNEWQHNPRLDDGVFRVVLHGDLSSRKAPLEAVEAFTRAFPKERDVELILKTHSNQFGQGKLGIPKFRDPRIKVYNEFWPRDSIKRLLRVADAFLWPSRGEGFGLPPLQAALSGVPVVMTTHTGMAEYYDPRYFYKIETAGTSPAPLTGEWFDPDVESAAAHLRTIYENPRRAKQAGDYVRENFNLDTFARNLSRALGELL